MTGPDKALFLDRDGVVNVDRGYVHRIEEFEFIDGIFEFCATAERLGYALIIATNQSGIGRGYYTEDDFHALMRWVGERFAERGVHLHDYYFCPDHPEGRGRHRRESFMRKPAPGMLLRAADDHRLVLRDCLMIGDNERDIAAGRAAGVAATILFAPDAGILSDATNADVVVRDMAQASHWLAGHAAAAAPSPTRPPRR